MFAPRNSTENRICKVNNMIFKWNALYTESQSDHVEMALDLGQARLTALVASFMSCLKVSYFACNQAYQIGPRCEEIIITSCASRRLLAFD